MRSMLIALFLVVTLASTAIRAASLHVVSAENTPSKLPSNGAAVDEVVVESSLHIKAKPKPITARRSKRAVLKLPINALLEHIRVKRAPRRREEPKEREYGQSQAVANAAANSHYNNRFGFGSSAANSQGQAFNAAGPSGSFGASNAGSVTQALNAGPGGFQNSAGASQTQSYTLPNGETINFASTNSFANGPFGNNANSRGSSVSVNRY